MTDVSAISAKRKRGRPRKDGSIYKRSPENHENKEPHVNNPTKYDNDVTDRTMIGKILHGAVEGSFDAGYFISVTIGNDKTPFRGIVFQPGKFIPITAGNDVAPKMKMCQRQSDITPSQVFDDRGEINGVSSRLETMRNEAFTPNLTHSIPSTVGSYDVISNNNSSYMVSEIRGTTESGSLPQVYASNIYQQSLMENKNQSAFDYQRNETDWKGPNDEFHQELFDDQFRDESKDLGRPDIRSPDDFLGSPSEKGNMKIDLNSMILDKQHELRDSEDAAAYFETDHLEQRNNFAREDPLLQHSYLISEPTEFLLQKP